MTLTRKQVKSFLEIVSSDEARPLLMNAAVCEHHGKIYLVGTDSYKLAALLLSDDLRDMVGKVVSREDITVWYKLASGKDRMDDDFIREHAQDADGNYPDWARLMPVEGQDKTTRTRLSIEPAYLAAMNSLAEMPLSYSFYDSMLHSETRMGIFVVMAMKDHAA